MKIRSIVAIATIVILCACAQPTLYRHDPELSQDEARHQWAIDFPQCSAEANQGTPSGFTGDLAGQMFTMQSIMNLREMCLEGRGWIKEEARQSGDM